MALTLQSPLPLPAVGPVVLAEIFRQVLADRVAQAVLRVAQQVKREPLVREQALVPVAGAAMAVRPADPCLIQAVVLT
ncbi:hypothetical protein V6L77_00270 [Pannonibacter sp. Pt2-lr]